MTARGLGLVAASCAVGFFTVIAPGTAAAEPCGDGMTMDATGECVLGLVNEASSSGGPNEATPGAAAQNACGIAAADGDANSIGADTADLPCP
jgi:hypothetical protein